jgi:hypothetical protein
LDYLPVSETLVFDLGETSQIVPIFLIDDFSGRGDRSFNVTLSNPTNAVLGDPASAAVTVTDDDPPGTGAASSGGCALAPGESIHGAWFLLVESHERVFKVRRFEGLSPRLLP